MSMMGGGGQVWRHIRTDRSAVASKVDRDVVRRVLQFAKPHRSLIEVVLEGLAVDRKSTRLNSSH